jgi:hypothetical protein
MSLDLFNLTEEYYHRNHQKSRLWGILAEHHGLGPYEPIIVKIF